MLVYPISTIQLLQTYYYIFISQHLVLMLIILIQFLFDPPPEWLCYFATFSVVVNSLYCSFSNTQSAAEG